eukprot:4263393-Amphidinium_carterae.1
MAGPMLCVPKSCRRQAEASSRQDGCKLDAQFANVSGDVQVSQHGGQLEMHISNEICLVSVGFAAHLWVVETVFLASGNVPTIFE